MARKKTTSKKSKASRKSARAAVSAPVVSPASYFSRLFYGRIGVGDYWIGRIGYLLPAVIFFYFFSEFDVALGIIFVLYTFYEISLAVRRLHDHNEKGWLAVALFVPVLNIYYSLKLAFFSGTKKQNSYGPVVPTDVSFGKRLKRIFCVPDLDIAIPTRFFSVRQNVMKVLAVVIVLGLAYLFKDVFIVAVVNGSPVYRWTVVNRLEQQGGSQVLNSLVTETLVRQGIRKAGVTVSQEEMDAQVKQIEDRLAAQGLTLEQALAEQGLTREQLIDDIRLQKSAEMIVSENITVTEEEVDAYIEENAAFFPETLTGEALRQTAREEVYAQKVSTEIQAWVQGLHAEAKILYLREYQAVAL